MLTHMIWNKRSSNLVKASTANKIVFGRIHEIIDSPTYKGVVDNNLKILGQENLYICSSSVFPTSGSVNPNNTIVGLGLRLGDYLAKN